MRLIGPGEPRGLAPRQGGVAGEVKRGGSGPR